MEHSKNERITTAHAATSTTTTTTAAGSAEPTHATVTTSTTMSPLGGGAGGGQEPFLQQIPPTPSWEDSLHSSRHGKRSRRGSRSVRSQRNPMPVVFSNPSLYEPWIVVVLALPLIALLIPIGLTLHDENAHFGYSRKAWVLLWLVILILALYMVVLPKQVDVRSNGSIGIKTFLITYNFADISRAYQAGVGGEDLFRPRLRFATSFSQHHRVIIRRRFGNMDLVVTPQEPEPFIQALEQVLSQLDQEKGERGERRSRMEQQPQKDQSPQR